MIDENNALNIWTVYKSPKDEILAGRTT